ncbi:hypothetical protein PR003_g26473 [Phytophthora rubi]|uniref:Uncharacterized protein n=1 Tax=Phytophthora rubi TaxID=129364 RepID=A0A6A4C608_9STRA|nr:hypothetical protein PR003_g26473 [Phytophthora rubi]
MDQLLLDVGLDANAAVAAITKVLKVGLVTDADAIMTAELLWNLTHRVLLDVELDAASTADVMSELLETQGWWMAAAPCRRKWSSSSDRFQPQTAHALFQIEQCQFEVVGKNEYGQWIVLKDA